MSLQPTAERNSRRTKLLVGLVVFLCLAAIVFFYNQNKRKQQSRQDDQATGYRPPQATLPIPAPTDTPLDERPLEHSADQTSTRIHPLDPVLKFAEEIRQRLQDEVIDYTATLTKRERVKGTLGKEERMQVKIRNPRGQGDSRVPLSAYLKFIPPSDHAGREVLWVDGRDNGNLHSYQFGIPVQLDPNGPLAMMGNKYPITEIGLLKMTEKLIEKGTRDRELGNCKVEIFEDQQVAGRACQMIQVTHDNQHAQFDFHIAQVYIDNDLQVPIRYAAYLWPKAAGDPPPLEEEYTYADLKLNVGLKDIDFDRKNPEYRFP